MDLIQILKEATEKRCSDIFIVPGTQIAIRKNDRILPFSEERIMPDVSMQLIKQLYQTDNNRSMDQLILKGDDDFSLSLPSVGRFRCNVYMQRNSYAAVLRVVYFELPNAADYHIPQKVIDLYKEKKRIDFSDRARPAAENQQHLRVSSIRSTQIFLNMLLQ